MGSMETDCRMQDAVVWKTSGKYDNNGNPTIGSPSGIEVRWEQRQGEALDALGQKIRTVATVVVNEDIEIGSILWLGSYIDMSDSPTPLYEVVDFNNTPDVKGRHHRRVANLTRYKDSLPESDT